MTGRRAKIVCTLGPAMEDPRSIRRVVEAAMDVARLLEGAQPSLGWEAARSSIAAGTPGAAGTTDSLRVHRLGGR